MIDYKKSAFILVRAPSRVTSTRKISSQAQHKQLLKEALEKGLLLYHAPIVKQGGKELAKQPWILDKNSVPKAGPVLPTRHKVDMSEDDEPEADDKPKTMAGIFCPYCEKPMKSTSGRTLHVKNQHPDKFEEYQTKK